MGLEDIIDYTKLTKETIDDALNIVKFENLTSEWAQFKAMNFFIKLLNLANDNHSDFERLKPYFITLITNLKSSLHGFKMETSKFELCTFVIEELRKNKLIFIGELIENLSTFSALRQYYNNLHDGHYRITIELNKLRTLMSTDTNFFKKIMRIARTKDHVLYPTVLKKLQEEKPFEGPPNEHFWNNIIKFTFSSDQEFVTSIQTLITMKTKHTSHTLVDNYTNFLNKLLDLPET